MIAVVPVILGAALYVAVRIAGLTAALLAAKDEPARHDQPSAPPGGNP